MKPNTQEEQELLEKESSDLAAARFLRRQTMAEERGDAENSETGRLIVRSLVEKVTEGLTQVCFKAEAGIAGRKVALADYLSSSDLDLEEIAFISLRALINRVLNGKNQQLTDISASSAIAMRLEDELFLRTLKKTDRGLVERWEKECNKRSLTRESAREFMRRQSRNMHLDWSFTDSKGREWNDEVKLKIGRLVLEVILTSTSMVYVKTIQVRAKLRKKFVYITPAFEEYLQKAKDFLVDKTSFFLPMVVPPRPWTIASGLYGGGYMTDHVRPYPLVKKASTAWLDEIIDNDPEVLITAVNAIQNTPWKVNATVLEALETVYHLDKGLAGLPTSSREELPPAPEEFDKNYRRLCWMTHERNRRQLTKRLFISQVIWLGQKFSEFDRFYFPHDLDSRGRAYPKPAFLNPQGPDYVKGLLEFSDGRPLGTHGAAAWLAVHVANSWGEDKVSMDKRIGWTTAHEEMILSCARNPLDDLRWTEADSPFQFLQAALAWQGYLSEGLSYVCHVPIAVDATCSGLQHYSAMLRDERGGRAVNLTNTEVRQDVYADVAARTVELMTADLTTDFANVAQAWLDFGMDRKLTKRSVMVVPYAATYISCVEYTREAVKERLDKGAVMPWAGDDNVFIHYGAKKIWKAIEETVVAASEAMRWISKSASTYANAEGTRSLNWGTQSGMVVWHRKPQLKQWRMDTILDGTRIRMAAYRDQPGLDPVKMASSTPPSFIHSLDAAHMCLVLDASLHAGLSDFGVIHDSFSTHACDMDVFNQCIRDTFHEMYADQDVLDGLRQCLQEKLEEPLPALPARGTLDIDQVRSSTFFFS